MCCCFFSYITWQEALHKHLRTLSDEHKALVRDAERDARRHVAELVKLILPAERAQTMEDELREVLSVVSGGGIVCLYDCKTSGEATTAPHLRTPGFKTDRLKKFVHLVLAASDSKDSIPRDITFLVLDAGMLGNKHSIMASFLTEAGGKLAMASKSLYLTYDEQEMQSRLQKLRSTKQLQQLETCYVVTSPSKDLVRRARVSKTFAQHKGTSAGNVLTGIPIPPLQQGWCASVEVKREIYGDMRERVGGSTEGDLSRTRGDKDVEPVNWHQMHTDVYIEFLKSETQAACLVDYNPFEAAALAAMQHDILYVGMVFSETHKNLLLKHLAADAFRRMHTEGDKLYRPSLAAVMKLQQGVVANPKTKAKAKAEGKKRTAGAAAVEVEAGSAEDQLALPGPEMPEQPTSSGEQTQARPFKQLKGMSPTEMAEVLKQRIAEAKGKAEPKAKLEPRNAAK